MMRIVQIQTVTSMARNTTASVVLWFIYSCVAALHLSVSTKAAKGLTFLWKRTRPTWGRSFVSCLSAAGWVGELSGWLEGGMVGKMDGRLVGW